MKFYDIVYSNKDTPIQENTDVTTIINYFTVKPETQQKMIDAWIKFVESYVKHVPGFISANLHKSIDGTRVFNYAQWKRKEDVEGMLSSPEAKQAMDAIHQIAEPDWNLYDVPYIALSPK
jgi:heme-degrading monooxygenase HmoA